MGLLRFLLALAVASGHSGSFFEAGDIYPRMPGAHSVQIFYMISGFLIALILSGKYTDTAQGNWIFYTNRAVKIYVPYFAILLVTVAAWIAIYSATGSAGPFFAFVAEHSIMSLGSWAFAIITNLLLFGMEWGAMLIDRGGALFFSILAIEQPPSAIQFTVIIPAWTLALELAFYVIAPFILRRHVVVIAAMALASYTLRFVAYAHGYRSIALEYRFFPFELSLFLYGALSYRLYAFLKTQEMLKPALSAAIALACALVAIAPPRYFVQHQHQMYAIVGLLLPALFHFSTRHNWDKWLGDLSYPIYLVHWPICGFGLALIHGSSVVQSRMLWAYGAVIVSVIAAIAINQFLVRPVDAWRQARVRSALTREPPQPLQA